MKGKKMGKHRSTRNRQRNRKLYLVAGNGQIITFRCSKHLNKFLRSKEYRAPSIKQEEKTSIATASLQPRESRWLRFVPKSIRNLLPRYSNRKLVRHA